MIRETVLLPIHPDKAATFEAIFAVRRTRVLAEEPGTLKYDLLRSDQGEALYVVEEWFADEEAKAFHLANSTDHEPMMACFAGGFTVHRLTPADATSCAISVNNMDRAATLSQLADSYLEYIRIAALIKDKAAPFRDFIDNWAAFSSDVDHHRRASNRVIWFNNPDAIKRREMLLSLKFISEGADTILRYAEEKPDEYKQKLMSKDKNIRLIVDHTVPISVIVKKLFEQGTDLTPEGIRKLLTRWYCLGLLTHPEDAKLIQAGLRSKMPKNWDGTDLIARYRTANIKSAVDPKRP